jgi:hypothetical protein
MALWFTRRANLDSRQRRGLDLYASTVSSTRSLVERGLNPITRLRTSRCTVGSLGVTFALQIGSKP